MFARRARDSTAADSRSPSPLGSAKDLAMRIGWRKNPSVPTNPLPTDAMLQQILDEFGLLHAIDEDGDLVVRWEKCSIYFFHYGEQKEVLQARLYVNARYDVDMRPALTVLLDDWNRTKLFPKAYTVLPDDGMVGVCAEQAFDFEVGASREQIKYSVGSWIHTMMRFADWLDEQI